MRTLGIFSVLVFLAGCSRHEAERVAFDAFLATNRVDRIVIAEEDEGRTNVIAGEQLRPLLARFAATNRVADPIRSKSYISGHITFYEGEQRVAWLHYFPREQVLSFGGYEFSFRDTNDMASLFR